jgi:hypothetical protein
MGLSFRAIYFGRSIRYAGFEDETALRSLFYSLGGSNEGLVIPCMGVMPVTVLSYVGGFRFIRCGEGGRLMKGI